MGEIRPCDSNMAYPRFEVYKTFLCVFMSDFMVFMRLELWVNVPVAIFLGTVDCVCSENSFSSRMAFPNLKPIMFNEVLVDLIHDTRHLCTRFRIDGIKAMSRGISLRGQTKDKICQCKKSRSTLFILSKRNDDLMVTQNVRFALRQN